MFGSSKRLPNYVGIASGDFFNTNFLCETQASRVKSTRIASKTQEKMPKVFR